MKELMKMVLATMLILLVFHLQGCVDVTVHIDQEKSLITAPVEYEEEDTSTGDIYVNHKKYI